MSPSQPIAVIDYGMSNLLNVTRALQHIGAPVDVLETPEALGDYEKIVLPGVGAFAGCAEELRGRGFVDPLLTAVDHGAYLLGICVGLQLLFDWSEEFGEHKGLGLLPGKVARIADTGADGQAHKIPHIGWNELTKPAGVTSWDDTMLANLDQQSSPAYFVHSYAAVPENPLDQLATCDYNGLSLCAAVKRERIMGCQFHPEKSGEVGLCILRNFLALNDGA